MPPGADRPQSGGLVKSAVIAAVITAAYLILMSGGRLSDDQINYVSIANRILDPQGPAVSWVPYRTFSFLLAWLFGLTRDHILSLKVIFAATAFFYLIGMSRFLSIFFKREPVIWAAVLISMTPGYTLGMTFWGFAGFEYILARTVFMAAAPWILWLFWSECPRRRAWGLIFCALGAVFSMEALLLLAVMFIYLGAQIIVSARVRAQARGWLGLGVVASVVISTIVYYIPVFRQADMFFTLTPIYDNIIRANQDWIQALPHTEFIDLFWKAAYACCWWTLFPPRLSDLLFALANQAALIAVAVAGLLMLRRRGPALAKHLLLWTVCVAAAAYGYPFLRYVGWKTFHMPPHIFEEVRAVKFFHPVLFIGAGIILERIWEKRHRAVFIALTAILCVSPLAALRAIPLDWKEQVYARITEVVSDRNKLGYAAKALAIRDAEQDRDLNDIRSLLEQKVPLDAFVLGAQYALRLSGRNLVMLYNDKRNGDQLLDGRVYARLPYWYASYQEISTALDVCDEAQVIRLAHKYHCKYVTAPCSFEGPRWKALHRGRRVSLYQLAG